MIKENRLLPASIWLLNILAIGALTFRTMQIGNDKAPALFAIFYMIILLVNGFLWLGFKIGRNSTSTTFRRVTLTLLALLIPAILYISFYE